MTNTVRTQYKKLFEKLSILHKDGDKEAIHILQDKIYRKFIKDIVNNKITSKDIKEFAKDMNKYVVRFDKGMWYS